LKEPSDSSLLIIVIINDMKLGSLIKTVANSMTEMNYCFLNVSLTNLKRKKPSLPALALEGTLKSSNTM
jgi:hypothetical protein